MFMEVFTRGEKDESGRPVLTLLAFNDFVNFFFTVKQNFGKFARNGAMNSAELDSYLALYEYSFSEESMHKFLTFFDEDGNGSLELNEVLVLNATLYNIEFQFLNEDDGDGRLDSKEMQSLFRALQINVTIKEMNLLLQSVPSSMTRNITFEKFVSLLFHVKQNLPEVRELVASQSQKVKIDFTRDMAHRSKKAIEELEQIRSEAQREAKRIIDSLAPGAKWEDPDFRPNEAVLFPFSTFRNSWIHSWRRPHEINKDAKLFVDGIDQGDVIQGTLEDCYFLSALSLLASGGSQFIEELFVGAYPQYGFYQCRFFKNNKWHLVTVDDRIPVNDRLEVTFSKCLDKREFWTPIIEKAYAKIHGSYQAIESGNTADALGDLTGEVSEIMSKVSDTDSLWEKLLAYNNAGYFLGCSLEDDSPPKTDNTVGHTRANKMGILYNHAYSVLQVVEVLGVRLLRIRNPWGSCEWTGPWSDESKEWTPEIMEYLNFQFADDGTFFMEFSDFASQFNRLVALLVMDSQWDKKSVPGMEWSRATNSCGGCINHPTWMNNPQLRVCVSERSTVFIALQQWDARLETHRYTDYPTSGIMVIQRDQQDDYRQEHLESRSKIVALSPYLNIRESSVSFKAQANQHYTVLFSKFLPGVEGKFTATVCSQHSPVHVTPLMFSKPKTSVKGEWVGPTAGGCPNWVTWHRSPQYVLHVPKSQKVTVTIVQERREVMNFIGFHIFPANPFKRDVLDPESYIFQCKYQNSATVSASPILDAGFYNILAATFEPGHEGKFGLVVQGEDCALHHNEPWQVASLSGSWKKPALAGGCSNGGNQEWTNNPKIFFSLTQPTTVNVGLEIPKNSEIRGIGFYLFNTDHTKTLGAMVGKSAFKTEKEVIKDFTLPAGDYIILPATYTKGVEGPFEVVCYSDVSPVFLSRV
eukprot:TRINITY_DN1587_c0_g1_i3.p1 TRINITY_DN1587_c0_g1~~TRINITY_DN1587_c0_g1_i3.p1  ORF type:complete len:922 (-),score=203.17 TRINITY_DN1587_c0_g1_i3:56-2821(-)